jgi:hypothetical protein
MLEVRIGASRRARCVACAKAHFQETPPAAMPKDAVRVPQHSLPIAPMRNADFVTPRQLARHKQYHDYRRRQSGEAS